MESAGLRAVFDAELEVRKVINQRYAGERGPEPQFSLLRVEVGGPERYPKAGRPEIGNCARGAEAAGQYR